MMFMKLCTAAVLTGLCVAGASGAAHGDSDGLVSADTLAKAGIATVWQTALPLKNKNKEKLDTLDVLGDGVFALTTTNYLFSLGAADGGLLFADRVDVDGVKLLPLDRSGDALIVVTGSSVKRLDVKSGKDICLPRRRPGLYLQGGSRPRFTDHQRGGNEPVRGLYHRQRGCRCDGARQGGADVAL